MSPFILVSATQLYVKSFTNSEGLGLFWCGTDCHSPSLFPNYSVLAVQLLFYMATEEVEVLTTKRNGVKLCFEGHIYVKQRSNCCRVQNNSNMAMMTTIMKWWWKCASSTTLKCSGTLSTTGPNMVDNPVARRPHNHSPCQTRIDVERTRCAMKQAAETTQEKPIQIYARCVENEPDRLTRAMLPHQDVCLRTIRNHRPYPKDPRSREELGEIPPSFTQTSAPQDGDDDDRNFLIYDNGARHPDRMLIFASNAALRVLGEASNMYADGNFDVAPRTFRQAYFIRCPLGKTDVTVVYALLPNKSQDTYIEMFTRVKQKCEALTGHAMRITETMTDFETAAMGAIERVFGYAVRIRGCFYHLSASMQRHIDEVGLRKEYTNGEDLRFFIAMLIGLAFLPCDHVGRGILYLATIVPPVALPLLNYFMTTYVGAAAAAAGVNQHNGHLLPSAPALFRPDIWNAHDATITNQARTNNTCEGFNNRFNQMVQSPRPPLFRCLAWFKKDEACVATLIEARRLGQESKKRKRTDTIHLQHRLFNLCTRYNNQEIEMEEFLRSVGFNIRYYRSN